MLTLSRNRVTSLIGMLLLLAIDTACADELFPRELIDFVPYQSNPLFAGTGKATWDSRIRERGCVLHEGNRWHFWYTGYNTDITDTRLLGYATSPDGLTWTRHSDRPIFTESWVEDMHVVKQGDTYYMVAEGRNDIAHLLTSLDGVRWQDLGRLDIRYTDGRPLTEGPYGTPTLWVEDGRWHLFYERRDRGVWLSTTKDRKIWTNVQDEPVLVRGPKAYDKCAIALNQIIKHKSRYYAIYHANADPKRQVPWTTNIATSEDLVTWHKFSGNPIVAGNFSSGQLVHDGKGYRLYTAHPDLRVYFPRDHNNPDGSLRRAE